MIIFFEEYKNLVLFVVTRCLLSDERIDWERTVKSCDIDLTLHVCVAFNSKAEWFAKCFYLVDWVLRQTSVTWPKYAEIVFLLCEPEGSRVSGTAFC